MTCKGCGGPLDDMGAFGFCSLLDCVLRREGYRIAMYEMAANPVVQAIILADLIHSLPDKPQTPKP
jgi:hypothetical protein